MRYTLNIFIVIFSLYIAILGMYLNLYNIILYKLYNNIHIFYNLYTYPFYMQVLLFLYKELYFYKELIMYLDKMRYIIS